MTAARLLASAVLCAALAGCSGFTHFHSPRALPARGGTGTANVLVPVDFSLRVGLGQGCDAGLRFTRPGMGFIEVHADVQRDLRPGGDGRIGWLSLATLGTIRGDRTRLVPEINLVGRIPTVAPGLQYRDDRL